MHLVTRVPPPLSGGPEHIPGGSARMRSAERPIEVCIISEAAQQISLVRHCSPFQQITYRVEPLLHQVTINARTSLLTEFVHQVIFADEELLRQLVYGQRVRVMLVDVFRHIFGQASIFNFLLPELCILIVQVHQKQ